MKNLFDSIKNALGRLEDCIRRFPYSFGYLCLITVAGSYMIISEEDAMEITVALIVGGLFCFMMELACEYGIFKKRPVSIVASLCVSACVYFVIRNYQNTYVYTALLAVSAGIVSLICFILYRDRDARNLFSWLIQSMFIVQIFTAVILSGISVCIAAFHFLIFGFEDVWKLYGVVFLAVTALFSITLFLSYVPRPDEEVTVSSTYRTMIHKALFFIYLVLIGILYLYILKIIFTWKMPVGRLNWFGSFALLFYVIFYLSVDETDGKIQTMFRKYGAYLLIPVLAIQMFAIVIRLNAYGLTTARYVSLIFIAFAVCFMLSHIFRFSVSGCFLFMTLAAVLFTCTPLNIYDVPNRMQEKRLKDALVKGGALIDGVFYEDVQLDAEYLEDAKSAYDYLRWSDGKKSDLFTTFAESGIAKSFYGPDQDQNIISFSYSDNLKNEDIDISGYGTMRMIHDGELKINGEDLTDFLLGLKEDEDLNEDGTLECELSDGSKVIFEYINYDYDPDSEAFRYLYWNGILLGR